MQKTEAAKAKKGKGLATLADDDLDEVAGGAIFYRYKSRYDYDMIIDDNTCEVLQEFYTDNMVDAWARADRFGVSHWAITWEEIFRLRGYEEG